MNRKGYTLVEIVIVVALMAVILIVGYRSARVLSQQAVQLSKTAANSRRGEFDRMVNVLKDRLGQAWSYSLASGSPGPTLNLIDANGTTYATYTHMVSGNVLTCTFADVTGTYTANPLTFTYAFTNSTAASDYQMQEVTSTPAPGLTVTTVNWKIPPPFYYTADYTAFRGLFLANDDTDLRNQVADASANNTGLLQHDLQTFTWNPKKQLFR